MTQMANPNQMHGFQESPVLFIVRLIHIVNEEIPALAYLCITNLC